MLSTALRNKLLDTGSLKTILAGGSIKIYSGAVPATADAAVSGTLLVTILNGGSGINLDTAAAGGIINKASAETWSSTVASGGTATYYRHVASGDTGALSTTEARIQGTIATVGADLNLSSTTLTGGATQAIDYYSVTVPAS
jgi:hypothetical protein